MGWALEHTPEVVTRLLPMYPSAGAHGRTAVLDAVAADVGCDVVRVLIVETMVKEGYSYIEVDKEVERSLAPVRTVSNDSTMTDAERVRRNVVAMAKYKKGGEQS